VYFTPPNGMYYAKFILGVAQYISGKINLTSDGSVSYTAEARLRSVRSYIAELPFGGVRYTANWRQVYFGSCTVQIRQNKLGASWRCILHHRKATGQCKILHHGVPIRLCKIQRQVYFALYCANLRCMLHHGVTIPRCKIHRRVSLYKAK